MPLLPCVAAGRNRKPLVCDLRPGPKGARGLQRLRRRTRKDRGTGVAERDGDPAASVQPNKTAEVAALRETGSSHFSQRGISVHLASFCYAASGSTRADRTESVDC